MILAVIKKPKCPLWRYSGLSGILPFYNAAALRFPTSGNDAHLKARCQGKKSTLCRENEIFSTMVAAVIDHFTIAAVSLGFGYQSLLIQSPIRIKASGAASDP
jgi:hypothetical protein